MDKIAEGNPPDAPAVLLLDEEAFDNIVNDTNFSTLLKSDDPQATMWFLVEKIKTQAQEDTAGLAMAPKVLGVAEQAQNDPAKRQRLQLLLAAELHDQAQTAINDYLRGDPGSLDKRHYTDQAKQYTVYPRMLEAALLLLPPDHLLRHRCKVKWHYFDGVCTRLAGQMSDDPKPRFAELLRSKKGAGARRQGRLHPQ